jgi:hypothetical protein
MRTLHDASIHQLFSEYIDRDQTLPRKYDICGQILAVGVAIGAVASFAMASRPPLSSRSSAELRARAAEYRRMAASAHTIAVAEALLKIAARYDALADAREIEERAIQSRPEDDTPPY